MAAQPLSRRAWGLQALQVLLSASLLQRAAQAQAITGTLKWSVRPWLQQLHDASAALAAGQVAPLAWQSEVEAVLGRMDLADLLKSLDFDALAAGAQFADQGERMQRLYFPDEAGRLQPLAFRPFLFTLRQGTAVVPHGHHNMATLHLMLDGRARVRHFDRLGGDATHMLLRPATDAACTPGQLSSVSDDHHNVHWFQAESARVFMFNLGVYQVRAGQPFGERDYVDPLAGTPAGDGVIRAPRLDRAAAYARYGRT